MRILPGVPHGLGRSPSINFNSLRAIIGVNPFLIREIHPPLAVKIPPGFSYTMVTHLYLLWLRKPIDL